MLKLKLSVALFAALLFAREANAQAPNPWPQSGSVVLSGQQVPYAFLVKGPSYVYYSFALPSVSQGSAMGTIGFPIASAKAAAQAQSLIQSRASLYWGTIKFPLP